ncbi:MAG: PEGA domain-containing protein, partial [Candidatus Omnitrophica bacterium]|nr:PEGA domain-containing protein [Candidatus Omnitrophota bacterium]
MFSEQRIRAFLFYLCLAVFFAGLPSILSFALGYKFDPSTFKFTKTGIISIKTQPEGVDVYLNGKLFSEKTPATINELIPGTYSLRLESERYYPWVSQVKVEARKVVRLEKIILFPKRTHIKQLNQEEVSSFWLDTQNSRIYYFNQE